MNDSAGLAAFFAAVAGLGLIIFFIAAVLWVLKSIGLAQMAENRGVENSWLAWLPVADLYIMGAIVEEMNLFGLQITNLGLWFPVICLLGGLLTGIPVLGFILFIALLIFQIAFIYKLFSMYTDQAVVYTVISIFFAFLWPVFIFSLRNSPLIEETVPMPDTNSAKDEQPANEMPQAPVAAAETTEESAAAVDGLEESGLQQPSEASPADAELSKTADPESKSPDLI